MSQQLIGLGTIANDGTGDDLRVAGDKINDNFTELYAAVPTFGAGVATFLATPSSANLLSAVTDETGTGALVFANTPTLVSPLLGTPTSGVLTNCTGYPTSALSGLGAGVATFLATPSSANLAAAVTGETGTGALVFATSPTLVTPVLGVASATSLLINGPDAVVGGTAAHLQVTDTGTTGWHAAFVRYGNDTAPASMTFAKSRGATGLHVNLENFDDIGAIDFKGTINGVFRHAARIEGRVYDQNVGVGALPNGTVCPGFLDFTCTNTDGSFIHSAAMTPVTGTVLTPAFGVGCSNFFPERSLHITYRDPAANPANAVTYLARLSYINFGVTFANGVGCGMEFETHANFENIEIGTTIESVCVDTTADSEDFAFVVKNMVAGAAATEQFRIVNNGAVIGVASTATGQLRLAHASSANLTTIQAGNAAAAVTYTWPTNVGAAGTVLTDAAGNGTLSWAAAGGLPAGVTSPGTGQLAFATGSITTSSQPSITITQTWNDGAVAFTGLSMNITDTASLANSVLFSFGRGGTPSLSLFGKATATLPAGTLILGSATADTGYIAPSPTQQGVYIGRSGVGPALEIGYGSRSSCVMPLDGAFGWSTVGPGASVPTPNLTGLADTFLLRGAPKVVSIEAASSAGGTWRAIATSPAQIASNQNDYNPGGSSYFQRWNSDAARDVTGLTFTAAQVDGQQHIVVNVGAQTITLKEQVTSTAANQFMNSTGADIVLSAKQAAWLVYDGTTTRWRVYKLN